jgi:ribosome-associated translation inhibitor RaiA
MQTPVQVTFRGMPRSDALAAHIDQRTLKLEHFSDRIVSCHVVIKLAGHHHRHGDRFELSIHIGLPGHELVVAHVAPEDRPPESAHASADRAFDEAERQLEDWVKSQRAHRRAAVAAEGAQDR